MRDDELPSAGQFKELTMFDWDVLTGAWRHYERGATITSSGFPSDLVQHYWDGNYNTATKIRIAKQFLQDHKARGEADWDGAIPMDACPWLRFYNFCWGFVHGFARIHAKIDGSRVLAFAFRAHIPVDYDGKKETRWYLVNRYIKSPYLPVEIPEEDVIDIKDFGGFAPDPAEFKFIKTEETKENQEIK